MKVYFSAAIYQSKEFGSIYRRIVATLEKQGHTVSQDTTETSLDEAVNKNDDQRVRYYKKVLGWIAAADLVVLEVSFPSTLHIGHEITLALDKGKPVVALYKKGHEPSFFLGLEHEKLLWVEYSDQDLEKTLVESLDFAMQQVDVRFNFFISPRIGSYLDWISKNKRLPRAVYLRRLIEEDMNRNNDYVEDANV